MARAAPKGLGPRGRRLWRELTSAYQLGPAQLELATEACRIADRLDRLDALLVGDEESWLRLVLPPGDQLATEVTVSVGSVLAEARLQATALKALVTEIRQATARAPGRSAEPEQVGGDVVTDLTARIAARRTASEGR